MTETVKALRIQLLKPNATIGIQWYSLGIALVICTALFAIIHSSTVPYTGRTTGALAAFYLSGVGVQPWLVNQLFPFSMALSVTRRAFIQATALLVAGESVLAGFGLAALNKLEIATHGWFVQMRVLNLPHIHQDDFFAQSLVYGVPMMALASIMACLGTVFRAFGQVGLWVMSVGVSFLAAATVAVLVLTHAAGHIVHFFASQPMLADLGLYPLILVAVFGGAWAVLMLRSRA